MTEREELRALCTEVAYAVIETRDRWSYDAALATIAELETPNPATAALFGEQN